MSELGAVDGSFASRRAAILSSARPQDVAALLRALANEQAAARRNVMQRWSAALRQSAEEAQARRQASTPSSEPARPPLRGSALG